uniref:Uncharacterized protein n=1 Tax=Tetranychus urticae TaxID=32264 RepID=T1KNN2_TETUR
MYSHSAQVSSQSPTVNSMPFLLSPNNCGYNLTSYYQGANLALGHLSLPSSLWAPRTSTANNRNTSGNNNSQLRLASSLRDQPLLIKHGHCTGCSNSSGQTRDDQANLESISRETPKKLTPTISITPTTTVTSTSSPSTTSLQVNRNQTSKSNHSHHNGSPLSAWSAAAAAAAAAYASLLPSTTSSQPSKTAMKRQSKKMVITMYSIGVPSTLELFTPKIQQKIC